MALYFDGSNLDYRYQRKLKNFVVKLLKDGLSFLTKLIMTKILQIDLKSFKTILKKMDFEENPSRKSPGTL